MVAAHAKGAAQNEGLRTKTGFFSNANANTFMVPDPLGLQNLPLAPKPSVIILYLKNNSKTPMSKKVSRIQNRNGIILLVHNEGLQRHRYTVQLF
jgi:hypothetical protein